MLDGPGCQNLLWSHKWEFIPVVAYCLLADPKWIVIGTLPILLHPFSYDWLFILFAHSLNYEVISTRCEYLTPKSQPIRILSFSQHLQCQIYFVALLCSKTDSHWLKQSLWLSFKILYNFSISFILFLFDIVNGVLLLDQPLWVSNCLFCFVFDL